VLVKRIDRLHNETVLERESSYFQNVVQGTGAGDVELFT
jgi:hypothetical protein